MTQMLFNIYNKKTKHLYGVLIWYVIHIALSEWLILFIIHIIVYEYLKF